jgi:hypothetical protein
LFGFAAVSFSNGLEFYECPVHVSGGRAWAAPPARPWIDHTGSATRDPRGKIKVRAVIGFASHTARSRWSRAIIEALLSVIPDALDADNNATEWALVLDGDPLLS